MIKLNYEELCECCKTLYKERGTNPTSQYIKETPEVAIDGSTQFLLGFKLEALELRLEFLERRLSKYENSEDFWDDFIMEGDPDE